MNFALQVHEARYIFPIPDGLKELSSDIIREVLRNQPQHINGFIADYLETMLLIRENARDSATVLCDVFREGLFFEELYKTKSVTRDRANFYATIIQANWRGYVARKKLTLWLKKRQSFKEEKEKKKSMKIQDFLEELGITYEEATRAAGIIQTAYRDSKSGKWASNEFGDIWIDESVPFGQRIRESDRGQGRYDRWDRKNFSDFFEMDEVGEIQYDWPNVGQLQRIRREEVPEDAHIVEFFGMRDLQGVEQYSYLIRTKYEGPLKEVPVGFLIPVPKSCVLESTPEIEFVNTDSAFKMGRYTYIFRDDVEREDLEKFDELLRAQENTALVMEIPGEFDYDPHWVLPRVLVRIKTDYLTEEDDEVRFTTLPVVVCEQQTYSFKAETFERTAKIIRQILREKCMTVQESLIKAGEMAPYKVQETGRIFPVDTFMVPSFIQKIEITPETNTGKEEGLNLTQYDYIFVPMENALEKKIHKGITPFKIPISRFQGYHTDYQGSAGLQEKDKVFIMGPKLTTPDGKPFTYESYFWDEFGEEAWYKLIHKISTQKDYTLEDSEAVMEEEFKHYGEVGEEYAGEKVPAKVEEEERSKKEKSIPTPQIEPTQIEQKPFPPLSETDTNVSQQPSSPPPIPTPPPPPPPPQPTPPPSLPPKEQSLEVIGEEKPEIKEQDVQDVQEEEENEPENSEQITGEDDAEENL